MPGWYYCKCKPGYETHGTDCHDINECYHGTHSCHSTATCVNSDGHFECHCPDNSTDTCRLSKSFICLENEINLVLRFDVIYNSVRPLQVVCLKIRKSQMVARYHHTTSHVKFAHAIKV